MRIGIQNKRVFFTSDTHFGHKSIIGHCSRPFTDVNHMNDTLVANWNGVVGKRDVVFHLGDVALRLQPDDCRNILTQLNGTKYLVPGNHDRRNLSVLGEHFALADQLQEVVIDGELVVLCHFPLESWNRGHHGVLHLHGHSHGSMTRRKGRMDVGVDATDYKPLEWGVIKAILTEN